MATVKPKVVTLARRLQISVMRACAGFCAVFKEVARFPRKLQDVRFLSGVFFLRIWVFLEERSLVL
jgi:hypothetical protein